MTRPLTLHIGHHFFGSGNVGDDLMLAGFLAFLQSASVSADITCCSLFDLAPMRRRFPQVRWFPYDPASRDACVAACDAWVGVGDSPFQTVVGPWFLDHLLEEVDLCQRHGQKPMYFLGVGVNDRPAVDAPQTRRILSYASHVWTRDDQSARWLAEVAGTHKVSQGSDLAHLCLRDHLPPSPPAPTTPDTLAYVMNFESPDRFPRAALESFIASRPALQHHWLVQEVRDFPGAERSLHASLNPETRARLDVRLPDYATATTADLLAAWGRPETLVSSRYHALIVGAWLGSRLVPLERNDKVRTASADFHLTGHTDFPDASSLSAAIASARPVPRPTLDSLATRARAACEAFLSAIASPSNEINMSTTPTAPITPTATLASVEQLNWPMFRQFMADLNAFAAPRGLRQFTNWSKVWEYPWLWFNCLGRIDWTGKRLVDLGTELSPVPWLIAQHGARISLVETHPDLVPAWEKLRADLNVQADYHVATSERLPFPDNSIDVLTSFSVIEHQPDKRLAVDEVTRVLKPGGLFAVSFDICEPQMGMTFPEWNGRALTMKEFEQLAWHHPAFNNPTPPTWNTQDIPAYLDWHRQSAPHHNYATAAAVLVKRSK